MNKKEVPEEKNVSNIAPNAIKFEENDTLKKIKDKGFHYVLKISKKYRTYWRKS